MRIFLLIFISLLFLKCTPTLEEDQKTTPAGKVSFRIKNTRYLFDAKARISQRKDKVSILIEGDLKKPKKQYPVEVILYIKSNYRLPSITFKDHKYDQTNSSGSTSKPSKHHKKGSRPTLRFVIQRFYEHTSLTNYECNPIDFKVTITEWDEKTQTISGTFEGKTCEMYGKKATIINGIIQKVKMKDLFSLN
ncbi:hypothetical protein BKI52_40605 [marine bacterium AO1-C]|nr:hypothetical protein BKI52_40605 [marine bacterium AO1-C]